jgi:hypothetical protein
MQRVHFSSGGRYPVLRAIAIIYLVLGGLSVLGGIVAVFWMLLRAPFDSVDRVILAAAALGGSVFWCALMLGAAEVLKLFIDIEHNTRIAYRPAMPMSSGPTNSEPVAPSGHMNRISVLEEETAEAALIRGH